MPSPVMVKEMDFPNALREVIDGRKVTRLGWGNKDVYVFLRDGFLSIRKADGTFSRLLVSDGDLLGLDWVIVAEAYSRTVVFEN